MITISIPKDSFSLYDICNSGQCFRMKALTSNMGYRVVAFDKILDVYQCGNLLSFDCNSQEFNSLWKYYFDLSRDYSSILSSIDSSDLYLSQAARFGSGIRILQQDLWETLISFIISQQSNIPRIKKTIEVLCARYGELIDDMEWSFPTPEALSCLSEEQLRDCGLGYRAKYILKTAQEVTSGKIDLNTIKSFSYDKAKEALLKVYGVGEKVADCVCLFSLHHLEAFPKDVHINRILEECYPEGFPFNRYHDFAGVIQQYLFYFDLKKGIAS